MSERADYGRQELPRLGAWIASVRPGSPAAREGLEPGMRVAAVNGTEPRDVIDWMWEASEGLTDAFADVQAYLGRCRFSDCTHTREPGCAIRAAIDRGELELARWESYQKLREEAVDKSELLRRKQEWSKGVARFSRNRNKEVW